MDNFSVVLLAFFSALFLMSAHLFSNRIYRYSTHHRNRIISFFGGIAIAYVFLDLLPRLQAAHIHLENIFGNLPTFLDNIAVPAIALLGFLIFFGLEHLALNSRRVQHKKTGDLFSNVPASTPTFILHFINLAFFNLVIGYILRFEAQIGIIQLILYASALSLHFIIIDKTMEENYQNLYLKYGRYIASLMPIIGWAISTVFPENSSEGYILLALISGIVLFNAINNEVPKGGGKNSGIFIAGALSYSAILLIVAWLTR
jgi:hypothetical protein